MSTRQEFVRQLGVCAGLLPFVLVGLTAPAGAQTLGLDDNPSAPLTGPPGPIQGLGAEDPFGLSGLGGLAPSPSLGIIPAIDADFLSPGPVIQHPSPNGAYIDSFSRGHVSAGAALDVQLDFSVDRVTAGAPGTAVASEAGFGQAHGDIYATTQLYINPATFAGTLGPGPFAGFLPSLAGGGPGNLLLTDESVFGLLTSAGVVGPGVAVPPPPVTPGQHDNLDSFDLIGNFDANGDGLFDVDAYFTIYPDEAVLGGFSAGDIFAVAAGDPGAIAVPYAPAGAMGLDAAADSIDALVMFDLNNRPIPQANAGAPGAVEPVIDYALFSLAPGSASLQAFGLDAADVFFTDFTGAFAVYAPSASLGLMTTPPGLPFQGDSVDALDVEAAPIPPIIIKDGVCTYELNNTVGERLTGLGGLANMSTGTADHLEQNWFWYRSDSDTREYALSNRIFASSSNNRARLVYLEPITDGQIPDALLFDLEYTLTDLSTVGVAASAFERCELVIAMKVRNLAVGPAGLPIRVNYFSYNDMDLDGTPGGDSAFITGVDNQAQLIDELTAGNPVSAVYKVSSSDHVRWEIGPFASIRNRLTDNVADALLNAAAPFGPGDYTGAQEWEFPLGVPGSVLQPPFDEWVGSVVKEVIVELPLCNRADVNCDGTVSAGDLAVIQSAANWFTSTGPCSSPGCP